MHPIMLHCDGPYLTALTIAGFAALLPGPVAAAALVARSGAKFSSQRSLMAPTPKAVPALLSFHCSRLEALAEAGPSSDADDGPSDDDGGGDALPRTASGRAVMGHMTHNRRSIRMQNEIGPVSAASSATLHGWSSSCWGCAMAPAVLLTRCKPRLQQPAGGLRNCRPERPSTATPLPSLPSHSCCGCSTR